MGGSFWWYPPLCIAVRIAVPRRSQPKPMMPQARGGLVRPLSVPSPGREPQYPVVLSIRIADGSVHRGEPGGARAWGEAPHELHGPGLGKGRRGAWRMTTRGSACQRNTGLWPATPPSKRNDSRAERLPRQDQALHLGHRSADYPAPHPAVHAKVRQDEPDFQDGKGRQPTPRTEAPGPWPWVQPMASCPVQLANPVLPRCLRSARSLNIRGGEGQAAMGNS